jgi:hypothetical protein
VYLGDPIEVRAEALYAPLVDFAVAVVVAQVALFDRSRPTLAARIALGGSAARLRRGWRRSSVGHDGHVRSGALDDTAASERERCRHRERESSEDAGS